MDSEDYKTFLISKTTPFPCPECKSSILPADYEKHCMSHGLNTQSSCAWCLGNTSWPSSQKYLNTKHLMECSTKFLSLQLDRDLEPRAYEPIWPKTLPSNRLTYTPESLNTAVSCIQMYLDIGEGAYWAHAIVRVDDFQNFLAAMDADEGRTQTLPFSCWCNGGECGDKRHRHIIIVAPSSEHFISNVWKVAQPIKSLLQLVNCLGYVSQRGSACPFSRNHKVYHVFESLPEDYKLVLAVQWKEGLDNLINQELNNMRVEDFPRKAVERSVDGKWLIKVKDILGAHRANHFPVTDDFYPCSYPTDYFVHLRNGKKFFFDHSPSSVEKTPDDYKPLNLSSFYDALGTVSF